MGDRGGIEDLPGADRVHGSAPSAGVGDYRAGGRLGDAGGRPRAVVFGIVAIVAAGLVLSRIAPNGSGPDPSNAALAPTAGSPLSPTPTPTEFPAVATFGGPPPTRAVPMDAGWLRWLDPASGTLVGDSEPADGGAGLAFADTRGQAIQVCSTTTPVGRGLVTAADLCAFDDHGALNSRTPIVTLHVVGAVTLRNPILMDAAASLDGRWFWLVAALRLPDAWSVTVYRVDLQTRAVAGSRETRRIPVDRAGGGQVSPEGWLVAASSEIRPVIRVSPGGSQLSVTMTETVYGRLDELAQHERVVIDSGLDPGSRISVHTPVGGARDLACDSGHGAWATEEHYVTICNYAVDQPFARIETPTDMTYDVALGRSSAPLVILAEGGSWMLDARRGVLYRWSSWGLTLSRLDVATQVETTVSFDPEVPVNGVPWPVNGSPQAPFDPGLGPLVWTQLAQPVAAAPAQLAGSSDGSVLYALGLINLPGVTGPHSVVWAVDAIRLTSLGRWDAPGPIDQLALAPRGRELVELVSPASNWIGLPNPSSSGPISDWTTAAWFVDAKTGLPLEVVGRLRGPGYRLPALLPASVDTLVGF